MNFLFYYVNLIRAILVMMPVIQLFKGEYKKIIPAAIALAVTFVPWLLSLVHIKINTPTAFLFPTVVFMSIYLGSGLGFYDSFSWWDRVVHFLSGLLFFSFGISLAEKVPNIGLGARFIFSASLSLALHEIWEVCEFLADSVLHTDHQHWQKHSSVINHQPKKAMQPPGLVDTMSDTIAGIIGMLVALGGWWVFLV